MTHFQQALKGAFFKISSCGLLQTVGIEKGIFFIYDTLDGNPRRWLRQVVCRVIVLRGPWYMWSVAFGVSGICGQWYAE